MKKISKKINDKIMAEFKEFKTEAHERWGTIYEFCNQRKKFNLKKDGQWTQGDIERMGKNSPHMTFNTLVGYINYMANEALQQDIGCDVEPRSSGASEELALVRRAQIMALQDLCNAYTTYGFALREGGASGIGAMRQVIKSSGKGGKEKTLVWEPIRDYNALLFSANAEGPGLGNKTRASVESLLTKQEFEDKYGTYKNLDKDQTTWEKGNRKKVYEYWRVITGSRKLYKLEAGNTIEAEEYDAMEDEEKPPILMGADGVTPEIEEDEEPVVEQWLIGNGRVLSGPELFPSTRIPIWMFFFRTIEIDGQLEVQSMTIFAEDAQKSKNFLKNVKAQMWAKSPTPIAFVPVESLNAVQEKGMAQAAESGAGEYGVAIIRYKSIDDNGNAIQKPTLEYPKLTDNSLVQEENLLREDIESAIGMNNTPFLQQAAGTSGVAIKESAMMGLTSNFDGLKSWQDMIEESLRCGLEVIERMPISMQIKLAGEDQQERVAWVNAKHALAPGMKNYTIDSNEEYQLSLRVRPNSRTMREQENQSWIELYKVNPPAAQLTGDLFMDNISTKNSKEAAKRLRAMLPPQALQANNPAIAMLQQQLQQAQSQMQQLQGEAAQEIQAREQKLQGLEQQLQMLKADKTGEIQKNGLEQQVKLLEVQVDQYKAETDRLKAENERMVMFNPQTPAPGQPLQ